MSGTLEELRSECENAYERKMLHEVPTAPSVDRFDFVRERAKGKKVLSLGHSGTMADLVDVIALEVVGVDKAGGRGVFEIDLENPEGLLIIEDSFDLILCGEILEHLGNPGNLLATLRDYFKDTPVLVTVPNAGGSIYRGGKENVNVDHVAWYSYRTLKTLVERYGYEVSEFFWYNGPPFTAEGLIFVLR
jgi:hypothetical protein